MAAPKVNKPLGEHLYFIQNEDAQAFKIGRAGNVAGRLRALQTGSVQKLDLVWSVSGGGFIEPVFHGLFGTAALRNEWYPAGSVPVDVMWSWDVTSDDPGSLLRSFGEAVHKVMRDRGLVTNDWDQDDEYWGDMGSGDFALLVRSEVTSRDEHHRRALAYARVCERIHKESPEIPALPHQLAIVSGVA